MDEGAKTGAHVTGPTEPVNTADRDGFGESMTGF